MAVPSPNAAKSKPSPPSMDASPSRRPSDAAASDDLSSLGGMSSTANDAPNSPTNPPKDLEIQPQASQRSEEYRRLFRLPAEEVLIRDFNCAFQENFLLQGHMYVFSHYICFYSNLFGFETKKVIPFNEVTSVQRAKVAGIFPTSIEIMAGGKKYFFTSFLFRDEAFKLIKDGWLRHGNGTQTKTDLQDPKVEFSSEDNGNVVTEKAKSFKQPVDMLDSSERNKDVTRLEDYTLPEEVEDDNVSTSGVQDTVEEDAKAGVNTDSSSSGQDMAWVEENYDAPKVPAYYTKVAESKFPVVLSFSNFIFYCSEIFRYFCKNISMAVIFGQLPLIKMTCNLKWFCYTYLTIGMQITVEDFFKLFFSDDAIDFLESYHRSCGDKDFRCSAWYQHEKFGHSRDASFKHPIKIYLGAKFGTCHEVQKFRVYKNSHLVIETSQEVNDVPYGDYFTVECLWDVERDGDESKDSCIMMVYVNVAFSKKTMWKGKIVQSTLEEARDVYAIWIKNAHDLLKQKNLEKEEENKAAGGPIADFSTNDQVCEERKEKTREALEGSHESSNLRMPEILPDSNNATQQVHYNMQGNLDVVNSLASSFRETLVKFCLYMKSQSHVSLLVTTFAVILLMQLSIVMLLSRPQQVQLIPLSGRIPELMAWLELRIHHLEEEMLLIETLLEKMQHEHKFLKAQLKDFEHFRRHQRH